MTVGMGTDRARARVSYACVLASWVSSQQVINSSPLDDVEARGTSFGTPRRALLAWRFVAEEDALAVAVAVPAFRFREDSGSSSSSNRQMVLVFLGVSPNASCKSFVVASRALIWRAAGMVCVRRFLRLVRSPRVRQDSFCCAFLTRAYFVAVVHLTEAASWIHPVFTEWTCGVTASRMFV